MEKETIIKEAILQKRNISAKYKGKKRVLSPHLIGIKDGEQQLLSLQVGGTSNTSLSSNKNENWRCMKLGLLSNVSLDNTEWESASNFAEWANCIDIIKVSAANL